MDIPESQAGGETEELDKTKELWKELSERRILTEEKEEVVPMTEGIW